MDVPAHSTLAFFARQRDRDDHLDRARALLERAIRQRHADGMLRADADLGELERSVHPAATRELIEDHPYDPGSPIGELVGTLSLLPTEADLVAVLLACEADPVATRLAAIMSGDALTVDALFEIVYRPRVLSSGHAAVLLHGDLAPDGPARRLGFLIVEGSGRFLARTVRLHPRVVAWLLDRRGLDAELASHARLHAPEPPALAPDAATVDALVHAFATGPQLVALHGAGCEHALRAAAHRLGSPALVVDAHRLDAAGVVAAFREATLHRAVLAFRHAEPACAALAHCLEAYPGTVAVIAARPSPAIAALASAMRPAIDVTVAVPPPAERLQLWQAELARDATLAEPEWRALARLRLGADGIAEVAEHARRSADRITHPALADAVRRRFDADLSAIGRRVDERPRWDDLVLPEPVLAELAELVDRIELADRVGGWGFTDRPGFVAWFSGPAGTGKSMTAAALADRLGLALYAIEPAIDPPIDDALAAAEVGHALLLVRDPAPAVLARLARFAGLAIVETAPLPAREPSLGPAIQFPLPDATARTALWQRAIPPAAPVGALDLAALAARFELSGGAIHDAALRAAYAAARAGEPIGMAHLERAALRSAR